MTCLVILFFSFFTFPGATLFANYFYSNSPLRGSFNWVGRRIGSSPSYEELRCTFTLASNRQLFYSSNSYPKAHAESRLHLLSLSNGASLHRIIAYGLPRLPFTFPLDSSNPFISSRAVDQKLCLNASRASLRTVLRNTATMIANFQGCIDLQLQVLGSKLRLNASRTCAFTNLTACTCACSATKEACLDCQMLDDVSRFTYYISGISGMIPQSNPFTVGYGLRYEVIKGQIEVGLVAESYWSAQNLAKGISHLVPSHPSVLPPCETGTRHSLVLYQASPMGAPGPLLPGGFIKSANYTMRV
ncbi:hypothetical protein B0H13DRAFT_2453717 [Mycena leptocephala]|nr:hypothetical protein B0H13DRAFT_2453717 [Mycena leptocephala]